MMRYPTPKKYIPINPEKWVNPKQVVARSNLERRFFKWMDMTEEVIAVASEEVVVHYVSPVDKKVHRYFPDVMFTVRTKEKTVTYVAEIKPDSQTRPPTNKGKKKKATLLNEAMTWAINEAKWIACEKWCKDNGFVFIKLTEKHLKLKWN